MNGRSSSGTENGALIQKTSLLSLDYAGDNRLVLDFLKVFCIIIDKR